MARSFETILGWYGLEKSETISMSPNSWYQQTVQQSFQSLSVSTDPNIGHLNSGLTPLLLLGSPIPPTQRELFGCFLTIPLTSAKLSPTLLCSHSELSESPSIASMSTSSFSASWRCIMGISDSLSEFSRTHSYHLVHQRSLFKRCAIWGFLYVGCDPPYRCSS